MRCFQVLSLFLFINLLGFSSAALAAEERLIAVVMANSQQRYEEIHKTFVENVDSFCADGCKIYVQTPNPDVMSLRNSVRKAVALDADLIITYGSSAALAAKAESLSVPTLFADVYDPVNLGLISSKNQKDTNMTGIRADAPVQALFKYFVETTKPQKLVVLYDWKSSEGNLQRDALEKACNMRDVVMLPLMAKTPKDHMTLLESIPGDADGLFLANSEHTDSQLSKILEFASYRQLPVITQRAGLGESGAFMVLETSGVEQGERLAEMAGQVLADKKIVDIPMYKPRQVGFVINLKVAKKYGIHVPFEVLSVATKIIR